MFSVTVFRCSFTSSWQMLGMTLLGMSLFISLGIWQLHRATEKRAWLDLYHRQQDRAPVLITSKDTAIQQYQPVKIQGQALLPMILLLDNQHYAHQFGYHILRPLLLADGHVILIDQGWMVGDPRRLVFPDLSHLPTQLFYQGQAYYPSTHFWVLGTNIEIKTASMAVIETLDIKVISDFLHKSVYPFIIRQTKEKQTALIRDWPIIAGSPARHLGYALQWFLFAAIAGIMYLVFHTKRNK